MRLRNIVPGLDRLSEEGLSKAGSPEPDGTGRSETRTWQELEETRRPVARRLDSLLDVPPDPMWSGAKTWEELAESRRSLARRLESLPGSRKPRGVSG